MQHIKRASISHKYAQQKKYFNFNITHIGSTLELNIPYIKIREREREKKKETNIKIYVKMQNF